MKTMSDPKKYGRVVQLTVRKKLVASTKPPTAASRVQSPRMTATPTASSPNAIARPVSSDAWADSVTNGPIGLVLAARSICACTEFGDDGSRNDGSVSLRMPA